MKSAKQYLRYCPNNLPVCLQTDRRAGKVNPVYSPNFIARDMIKYHKHSYFTIDGGSRDFSKRLID
jgi:hypothetical protein